MGAALITIPDWVAPLRWPVSAFPASVQIWRIALDGPETDPRWLESFTELERLRWSRFRFARDAQRYLRAHQGLRLILADYLALSPESLQLSHHPEGKPYLRHPGAPSFSLSHSQGEGFVALASSGAWGLDAEHQRPLPELAALARSQLRDTEYAAWRQLPAPDQLPAFFCAWTRKEAALKALGTGLRVAATELDTGITPQPRVCAVPPSAAGVAPTTEIHLAPGGRIGDVHLALAECLSMESSHNWTEVSL